jgi:hypothetical protein
MLTPLRVGKFESPPPDLSSAASDNLRYALAKSMTCPESETYFPGPGIRPEELVFSLCVPGLCDRLACMPGTGDLDFAFLFNSEPRLSSAVLVLLSSDPKMPAIAPGFFLPPCVTLFGIAWLSMLGIMPNWYCSSGLSFGLGRPLLGRPRPLEAGGEEEPCEGLWGRGAPGAGGGEAVSSMLRIDCPCPYDEPGGLVMPTPKPAIDECLAVGPDPGPTSSMLRTGDCAKPGLAARCEAVLCCEGAVFPSKRAITSLISSSRAFSSDMVAVVFWSAISDCAKEGSGTNRRLELGQTTKPNCYSFSERNKEVLAIRFILRCL